jgi:sigma-B regulation protein RsbU (phosphoserine phosphatase)
MPRAQAKPDARLLLLSLVALFVANTLLTAWAELRFYARSGSAGFGPQGVPDGAHVARIVPQGPASALREGDAILALDDRGVRGPHDVYAFFHGRPPGPYRILVRRDGQLLAFTLATNPFVLEWTLVLGLVKLAVNALFTLAGIVFFVMRPEGKAGLLLSILMLLFVSSEPVAMTPEPVPLTLRALSMAAESLAIFFWPVLAHFLLVFPEPSPLVRRFPRLEWLLYVPTAAVFVPYAAMNALFLVDPDRGRAAIHGADFLSTLLTLVWVGSVGLGLVSMMAGYRQASRGSRRRLRVAVAGLVLGLLPLLVLIAIDAFYDLRQLPLLLNRVLGLLALLALAVVPLALGYAILWQAVIPVRLILRRSLRYLLVSRGFAAVEAAVVIGVVVFVLTGARAAALDRLSPRADVAAAAGAALLAVYGLRRLSRRIRNAIDRRFFREAYDARHLLTSFPDAVREVPTAAALVDLVSSRVQEALHPESVRVFVRDDALGRFVLAHPAADSRLVVSAGLVERLSGSDRSVTLDTASPEAGCRGAILALALRGRQDLRGVLVLGPRKGDLPYTREDRALLLSVASQAGLSLENVGLVRQLAEQERVAHEIEIAAEVQRRLFPDRPPEGSGLDLAGFCDPAGDVGGDYYDYLELGRTQVGFAVADVAGKGLPAALLMSMVQASLRSQATGPDLALEDMAASMSRLLHRSTAPNAYATFFCAVYETDAQRLRYVNAGHNPPLVVRADGAPGESYGLGSGGGLAAVAVGAPPAETATRLTATGLVLGALADSPYTEETVRLRSGDLVVAYTDGVTEAFNAGDEEFGDQRLFDLARSMRGLQAADIVAGIAREVEAWRGGRPAHDDVTLVVAKVR